MPKKKEPVIVTQTPIKIVTEESDDEIEAVSKKKVYSPAVETDRRKKGNNVRTEAQKLAFEKAKLPICAIKMSSRINEWVSMI